MKNFIKSNDLYGHRLGLNLNKHGPEYKTVLGGFVSILVKLIILGYAAFRTLGMYNHDYNHIVTYEMIRTSSQLEKSNNFQDFQSNFFFIIMKEGDDGISQEPLSKNEYQDYITVKIAQKTMDFTSGKLQIDDLDILRECIAEDFAQNDKIYQESFKFYSPLCLGSKDGLELQGTDSTSIQKTLYFYIKKCEGPNCKNEKQINDFINQINVRGFSITEKIDFTKYGEKPVYSTVKKHYTKYLNFDSQIEMNINVRENHITTEDSFIQLGFNGIKDYIFHDIGDVNAIEKSIRSSKIIFSCEIFQDINVKFHKRTVYSILSLFADIGGVMEIFHVFFAFFIEPYNNTSFILFAASGNKFDKSNSFCQTIGIVFINSFSFLKCLFPKSMKKLKQMFDNASDLLSESMDILTISEEMQKLIHQKSQFSISKIEIQKPEDRFPTSKFYPKQEMVEQNLKNLFVKIEDQNPIITKVFNVNSLQTESQEEHQFRDLNILNNHGGPISFTSFGRNNSISSQQNFKKSNF